jgi:hypothetical protein
MTVLGVGVRIPRPPMFSAAMQLGVDPMKGRLWLQGLEQLAAMRCLPGAEMQTLVGRLSFAVHAVFGRLASAHMPALFEMALDPHGDAEADQEALEDIAWWKETLLQDRKSEIPIFTSSAPPVIVLSDAEGTGGIGAVLRMPVVGSPLLVWRARMPSRFVASLAPRATQINPFELLAVLFSVSTWCGQLQGREVLFCIDNTVALSVLHKGRSPKKDLNKWVREANRLFAAYSINARFVWVPSKLNLGDLPSRGSEVPGAIEGEVVFPPLP